MATTRPKINRRMRFPRKKSTGTAQYAQDRVAHAAYLPRRGRAANSASALVGRSGALAIRERDASRRSASGRCGTRHQCSVLARLRSARLASPKPHRTSAQIAQTNGKENEADAEV